MPERTRIPEDHPAVEVAAKALHENSASTLPWDRLEDFHRESWRREGRDLVTALQPLLCGEVDQLSRERLEVVDRMAQQLSQVREEVKLIDATAEAALHPEPAQEPGTYLRKIREIAGAILDSAPSLLGDRIAKLEALEPGWDSYGGEPPTKEALERLRGFNRALAYVPMSDGGVQVEFHALGLDFEVEIGPDGEVGEHCLEVKGQPSGDEENSSGVGAGQFDGLERVAVCLEEALGGPQFRHDVRVVYVRMLGKQLVEFDAWLSFRPEFAEVLTVYRSAFGTDTSAAATQQSSTTALSRELEEGLRRAIKRLRDIGPNEVHRLSVDVRSRVASELEDLLARLIYPDLDIGGIRKQAEALRGKTDSEAISLIVGRPVQVVHQPEPGEEETETNG